MGYYTNFSLKVLEGDKSLIALFRQECEYANMAFDDNGNYDDNCKWYDSTKDLQVFSAKHPEALFLLEGEGEEAGDVWKEYHKAGKYQRCQARLVFEEYNEEKLIE